MQGFIYEAPTKVVFGKAAELQAGRLVKERGAKKVLVHYGGGSAVKSGLLERVHSALQQEGIDYISLGGVLPNPRLQKVYEGIALGKQEQVDFILAVGGGSVIDSAKAIGYGLANEFDVWDIFDKKETPKAMLPVGCILTIAATGSEMSDSTVITKEEGLHKRGYNNGLSRPVFAILNPELLYTLPQYQTMSGCVDIMMHTLERYFTAEEEPMRLTQRFSEALLRTTMECAQVLLQDPKDYNARAETMWAGSLSHNGLMQCGSTRGDWACHRLEHELGGLFDVAHGAGLSAVWGSWARYVYACKPERFAALARNVLDVPEGEPAKMALAGIEKMEDFFRSIEMPVTIQELGVTLTDEDIEIMAEKCANLNPNLGEVRVLRKEDMIKIYNMARM